MSPPMHRDIIPAQQELPGPEKSVRMLPASEEILESTLDHTVAISHTLAQQETQVDALAVIVEFALMQDQAGLARERNRQAGSVNQVVEIIARAPFEGSPATLVIRKQSNFGQRLHYETS